MTRTLRTSEPASRELTEAVRWYEARRAGFGAEFFDAVVEALNLVEARPEIGSPLSGDHQTRRVVVSRFPYQIVYRLRPREIIIVAVAHSKRRPGYWKSR